MISNLQKILQSYPQLINQVRNKKTLLMTAMDQGNYQKINKVKCQHRD
jgi:hypothetical protein